jgi:hypothetical protein
MLEALMYLEYGFFPKISKQYSGWANVNPHPRNIELTIKRNDILLILNDLITV